MRWGCLLSNRSGVASAEMALVMPMLIILMFSAFEIGNYFLNEHVVVKAVRDGARYAGRQRFVDMPCGASLVEQSIKNLVRTGTPANGGTPKLYYWTNDTTITITTACPNSGSYLGIYNGLTSGERIVTVSAVVPYTPLFASFGFSGFGATGLDLRASAESAVMGI